MSDSAKRANSGRAGPQLSASRQRSAGNARSDGAPRDLASREEEYKKLNAELEAKTANLVKEAEDVLKGQDSILGQSRLLDNINTEEFLKEFEDDLMSPNEDRPTSAQSKLTSARPLSATKLNNQSRPQSKTKKPTSAKIVADILIYGTPLANRVDRDETAPTGAVSSGSTLFANSSNHVTMRAKVKSGKSNVEDVAMVEDTFMTEFKDFSLQKAIDNMQDMDLGDEPDDVLPQAAQDMGSEAQIRFLKAKLRVMQEEMDRLGQECNKKDEECSKISLKVKELEEERGRLTRTNAAQTTQIEKFKKIAEDSKSKSDSLETQLTNARKELDQLKRSQKQQATSQSATEVRLNRALEEIERYKEQLAKSKSASRETSDLEKRRVDQLLADNKRLEKQKNELMAGFKKQLKLIDILKRQKMHIEAAKMLSFSEEEFVKALEWGS